MAPATAGYAAVAMTVMASMLGNNSAPPAEQHMWQPADQPLLPDFDAATNSSSAFLQQPPLSAMPAAPLISPAALPIMQEPLPVTQLPINPQPAAQPQPFTWLHAGAVKSSAPSCRLQPDTCSSDSDDSQPPNVSQTLACSFQNFMHSISMFQLAIVAAGLCGSQSDVAKEHSYR